MGRVLEPPAANAYSERVGAHVETESESVARAVDIVKVIRVVGNEGDEARGGEGAEVTREHNHVDTIARVHRLPVLLEAQLDGEGERGARGRGVATQPIGGAYGDALGDCVEPGVRVWVTGEREPRGNVPSGSGLGLELGSG